MYNHRVSRWIACGLCVSVGCHGRHWCLLTIGGFCVVSWLFRFASLLKGTFKQVIHPEHF